MIKQITKIITIDGETFYERKGVTKCPNGKIAFSNRKPLFVPSSERKSIFIDENDVRITTIEEAAK